MLLLKGIYIDSIDLISSKIEGLYIKLDKKLILRIDKIKIERKEKSKNAKEEIFNILNRIQYIKKFFKEIDIEKIYFQDNLINFYYFNKIFQFNSKHLFLRSLMDVKDKTLLMEVIDFKLKDFNLSSKGKVGYNFVNDSGYFDGKFNIFNVKGSLKIFLNNENIKFYLSSNEFDSLEPLMNFLERKFSINPEISSWIYKKVKAKQYEVKYFEGNYDLKRNRFDLENALAIIKAKDAKIKFHPKLKAVDTDGITIFLKDKNLRFKLENPKFYDRNLSGSFVTITSLGGGEKSGIDILLKIKSPLDEKIQNILKVYKIKIPLLQTKGETKGFLHIKLPHFNVKKIDVKGEFETETSKFLLDNKLKFFVKKANVLLDNNFVTLKNSEIVFEKFLDFRTNGIIDIKNQSFNGDILINDFLLRSSNEKILDIKNLKASINVVISKRGVVVSIPSLFLDAYFSKNKNIFFIKHLSKISSYSPLLKNYKIKRGSLDIQTKDFKDFKIYANLKDLKTPFRRDGKDIKNMELNIYVKPDFISVFDAENSFFAKILQKENIIQLKGIDLALKNNLNKSFSNSSIKRTKIIGLNSNLIFDNEKVLICDSFSSIIDKNFLDFECKHDSDRIYFLKKVDKSHLTAKNISDFFINSLNKKKIFQKGRFSIELNGFKKSYKGVFSFKDTTMKNLEAFNNLMAFINTIPSLLFLQGPGFSKNGYKIKNGKINFLITGNIVTLTKIDIKGYSADILGSGYINKKDGSLDLDLQISTLQNIDKIIKNIPIVGYIVLGEDKRNSVTVKIRGNIKNPKIETYIIKDIFKLPFNMIERVFSLPFEIFSKEKSVIK